MYFIAQHDKSFDVCTYVVTIREKKFFHVILMDVILYNDLYEFSLCYFFFQIPFHKYHKR